MLKAPPARRLFTYEHEASGEKKRVAFLGRRRPKFHALKSGFFLSRVVVCRFVIELAEGIDVRKDVVLPVDVHHSIEQTLELGRRE
jgi:hypothetical protein